VNVDFQVRVSLGMPCRSRHASVLSTDAGNGPDLVTNEVENKLLQLAPCAEILFNERLDSNRCRCELWLKDH
jgi:hypothetical protein